MKGRKQRILHLRKLSDARRKPQEAKIQKRRRKKRKPKKKNKDIFDIDAAPIFKPTYVPKIAVTFEEKYKSALCKLAVQKRKEKNAKKEEFRQNARDRMLDLNSKKRAEAQAQQLPQTVLKRKPNVSQKKESLPRIVPKEKYYGAEQKLNKSLKSLELMTMYRRKKHC